MNILVFTARNIDMREDEARLAIPHSPSRVAFGADEETSPLRSSRFLQKQKIIFMCLRNSPNCFVCLVFCICFLMQSNCDSRLQNFGVGWILTFKFLGLLSPNLPVTKIH